MRNVTFTNACVGIKLAQWWEFYVVTMERNGKVLYFMRNNPVIKHIQTVYLNSKCVVSILNPIEPFTLVF